MKYIFFLISSLSLSLTALAQGIDYKQWAAATADSPYDVTFLLQNASCTGNYGWRRNSADAAANYNTHNTEFDNSLYSGTCVESWYWSPPTNGKLIWQEVDGLLPGTYRFTAYVVGQVYNNASNKGKCLNGLHLFASDAQTDITSSTWQELKADCQIEAGETLTVGILADASNKNDWTGLANCHLYCLAPGNLGKPEQIALHEGYDVNCLTADLYADVLLKRTLPTDRPTTLCLPFDVDKATVNSYFTKVQKIVGASRSSNVITVKTSDVETMERYNVYLVTAKEGIADTIAFHGVFVSKAAPEVCATYGNARLTGSCRRQLNIADAYILDDDGKTFRKSANCSNVMAFSGYFIDDTDDTEGIESVDSDSSQKQGKSQFSTLNSPFYYDLSGRQHKKPVRGVNIMNGKKIIK